MINFNGSIQEEFQASILNNRGFLYGDRISESFLIISGEIKFWEAHYFRLMASMRILRMNIPMSFTMEFMEEEIKRTLGTGLPSAMGKMLIWRDCGDVKAIENTEVNYLIEIKPWEPYASLSEKLEFTVYKDFKVSSGLLSSIEGQADMVYQLGGIFARENGCQGALILNSNNSVIGSTMGTVFMLHDNILSTPPISDGARNTVFRKELIKIVNSFDSIEVEEKSLTVFDISKADEVIILSLYLEILGLDQFRKSKYQKSWVEKLRKEFRGRLGLPN